MKTSWAIPTGVDVELYPDPVSLQGVRLAVRYADRRALSLRPVAFRVMRLGRTRRVYLTVEAEVVREVRPV